MTVPTRSINDAINLAFSNNVKKLNLANGFLDQYGEGDTLNTVLGHLCGCDFYDDYLVIPTIPEPNTQTVLLDEATQDKVGYVTLTTVSQNLSGAVNEINNRVSNGSLSNLGGTVTAALGNTALPTINGTPASSLSDGLNRLNTALSGLSSTSLGTPEAGLLSFA